MLDRRPAITPFTAAFAREAVVTPLGSGAVVCGVIWEQEDASPADQAVGAGVGSALNSRHVAAVPLAAVPTLPFGSMITGGPEHLQKDWKVVSVVDDPDYHFATVI